MQDLLVLAASYGSSTSLSTFLHVLGRFLDTHEKELERRHERELAQIKQQTKQMEFAQKNISERDRTQGFWGGSFFGWTRRLIVCVLLLLILSWIWGELHMLPVNLVYTITHHFFWFQWTSHHIYMIHGVVITPFFRQLCLAMLGLYFGPMTVQQIVRR